MFEKFVLVTWPPIFLSEFIRVIFKKYYTQCFEMENSELNPKVPLVKA